jgi:tetratricopeptide (TPR) repeat protein
MFCSESASMKLKFRLTIARVTVVLAFVVSIGSVEQFAFGQHSGVGTTSRIHHSGQPAINGSAGFSQPNFVGQRQNFVGSSQGGFSQGGATTGFRSGLQPGFTANPTGLPMTSKTYNEFVPAINAIPLNGGNSGFGQMHHHHNAQMGNNFGQGFQANSQSGVMIQPSANGTQPFLGNNINYGGYNNINNNAGGIGYQQTNFRHAGRNHHQWNGNFGNNGNVGFNGNIAPVQGYGIGNFSSQQFNNGFGSVGFGNAGFGGPGYGGLGYAGFGGMVYAGPGFGSGFGNIGYAGNGFPGTGFGGAGFGGGGFGGGGFGGGGFGPLAYGSGYLGYTNPYFNNASFNSVGQARFNYNQPILVNSQRPMVSIAPSATIASRPKASNEPIPLQTMLNAAIAAFKRNQFDMALKAVNQGIYEYPNEAVLHEFRALVLFAKGDYQPAAATMHSVLAVSRGWDWATMISLYGDVEVYTTQLRALEGAVKKDPDDGASRFLLAYHYMTAGFTEPAARMLRKVVMLVPSDRLAAELLKKIDVTEKVDLPELAKEPTPQPTLLPPPEPTPIVVPIDPEKLIGAWQASRIDGSAFALTMTKEKTFAWSFTPKDQSPQSFDGTYSVQGDTVTLERNGGGSLIAKIRPIDESHFQFKLIGAPDDDPGIDFAR